MQFHQKNYLEIVLKKIKHLQLPNFNGQAWASMGKSSSCMGHSADMVNLTGRETEFKFFL